MSPIRRLFAGDHGCGKTMALAEAAAELLPSGFAAGELLALSVHRAAVRGLRATLRERLGAEIPTAQVRRRAVAILEQFPDAAHLAPGWKSTDIISGLDRRVLMRRAWGDVANGSGTLYARYGARPGAGDWLVRVFDAFAEWSGTADPERLSAIDPDDDAPAELWAAYRQYLALCRKLGLVAFQEALPRALDALREPEVYRAVAPRVLLLDDLDLFRPSELLFARALLGPSTHVVAATTEPPARESADAELRFLRAWCDELGIAGVTTAGAPAPLPRTIVAGEYPTPDHEAAAIARQIATTFPANGRFADYAIVSFDPELVPRIRRALPQWGIAVEGMEQRDARTLALAPLLLAGMRLLAGVALPRDDFAAFVRHPLLGLDAADSHRLVGALDDMPWRRGPGGGYGLQALHERYLPNNLSYEAHKRLRRIVEVTERLRVAELAPSVKLRRWIDALQLDTRAAEMANSVLPPWAAAADELLLASWLGFLQRSEEMRAGLGETLPDVEAVDVLASSQALVEPVTRRLSDAVQLWQPDQLGGCAAETVWIAGLNEDLLPAKQVALPWAPPAAFASAFAGLPGCVPPEEDDRAGRWQRAAATLRRAAGRAQRSVAFSWSATDQDGRRRLPSPVMEAFLAERAAASGDLQFHDAGAPSRATGVPSIGTLLAPLHEDKIAAVEMPPCAPFQTSPSAIEDFLQCPRRYFYARVLNLYDVASSPRQALGHVVHAALRDLKQEGEHASDTGTLLERHWPASGRRFGARLREAAYRRLAEKAVDELRRSEEERAGDGTEFLLAEASFVWSIAPEVELRGTIDRIDRGPEGLIVLDYKLGTHSPTVRATIEKFAPPLASDEGAGWQPSDLQLPLYALAVEQGALADAGIAPGERVAEIGLVYPLLLRTAKGKASEMGRRMIHVVDHAPGCQACDGGSGRGGVGVVCREQLDAVVDRVRATIDEMRGGVIDPLPREGATTCRSCAFRTICPAPQG